MTTRLERFWKRLNLRRTPVEKLTFDQECFSLIAEALDIIDRDGLKDHFSQEWRDRAEALTFPEKA